MDFKELFLFVWMLTLGLGLTTNVYSQPNLVPNPGFEDYVNCPHVDADLTIRASLDSNINARNWFSTGIFAYFNRCANPNFKGELVGVPQNFGGYQEGHIPSIGNTSNGYMFASVILQAFRSIDKGAILASYLQCKLIDSLIPRLNYKGTFFVSPCGLTGLGYQSWHSTNDSSRYFTTSSLGIFFGSTPLKDADNWKHYVRPAQVNNNSNRNLNDTVNWMEVSGEFEAIGNEVYLAIGSFNDSANTTLFNSYGYTEPWIGKDQLGVIYFFDNVSLFPQNTTHLYDTLICINTPLVLSAHFKADSFEWYDGNRKDKVRNFTNPGFVWVKNWLYGGSVYMIDSFNLISTGELNSGLPNDTFICHGQNYINLKINNGNILASYLWSNMGSSKSETYAKSDILNGKIWVKINQNNCQQTDTVNINFHARILIPIIDDTSICFEDIPQILLDAGRDFKSYLWQPTGETTRTILGSQSETYILTVVDSFNCVESKSIVVDELCSDNLFLPNAFTPNGDGLNDDYRPYLRAKNIQIWEMRIFDRWGNEIFQTNTINEGWNGEGAISGYYFVIFKYSIKNDPNEKIYNKGFTLLR